MKLEIGSILAETAKQKHIGPGYNQILPHENYFEFIDTLRGAMELFEATKIK